MAYNSNKGPQHSGDIQYEGDPNDVQIDFENDQIILRTGGAPRVSVTNTALSASGLFHNVGVATFSDVLNVTGAVGIGTAFPANSSAQLKVQGPISGSADFQAVGSVTFGSTLNVSGTISGSSALHITGSDPHIAIGARRGTSANAIMLNVKPGEGSGEAMNNKILALFQRSESTDERTILAVTGSGKVAVGGAHLSGVLNVSGTVAETLISVRSDLGYEIFKVDSTNPISGSGIARLRTISASSDVYVTGAVKATTFFGDGSNLTGIAGAASGSARLYSSTGIETSGYLRVSGSITSSMGIHVTGAIPRIAIGDKNDETSQSGLLSIRPSDTSNQVLMMVQAAEHEGMRTAMAISGSGQVAVGGGHLGGIFNVSGSDAETLVSVKADAGEILSVSALNCLSGAGVARLETLSASSDLYVTGAVKANVFFGDGSNLTGISTGDTSGSARVYSGTGLETAGYLKVSGSTTLGGALSSSATISSVGSISSSADVAVTGAIHAASFHGDGSGLTNLPAGSVSGSVRHYSSTGLETSGYLKVSGSSTLNGITATTYSGSSTMQVVGATILGGNLNVSGSTIMEGVTANGITNVGAYSGSSTLQSVGAATVGAALNVSGAIVGALSISGSNTISGRNVTANQAGSTSTFAAIAATSYSGSSTLQTVGNALFGGTIGASGSVTLKVDEPTIHFSSSTANLGTMGFNNSSNILIQNETTNKHIVFKANDNGTIREGFRIDGAVPEVVVNQGADSLIDFRVESQANQHMFFVDGSTNKIGVNSSAPSETLSVVGNISGSSIARVVSLSASSDIAVTGAIHANTYYGDGSNLTGVGGGSVSGSARHYSSTGLETSGYLKVSGSTTLAGTVRSGGRTHITHHSYANTGTAAAFIPFVTETESTSGGDRRNLMIAPLPGRLLKVWVRTKNAQNGNVTVKLFKAGNGTEDFNGAGDEVEAVTATMTDANTSYAFTLSGSSPQYSAGEIIGVEINPAANGGDYNVTCIWEYDDTGV